MKDGRMGKRDNGRNCPFPFLPANPVAGGSFLVVAGKTEGEQMAFCPGDGVRVSDDGKTEGTAFPNPSPCGSSAEIHVAGPTGNSRWCSPGTEPSGLSCGTKAKKTGDGISISQKIGLAIIVSQP